MIARLCIPLIIVLLAFALMACSGEESPIPSSGTAASLVESLSEASLPSEASAATEPLQTSPDLQPTPPSLSQGQSAPPQSGPDYAERLPQLEQAVREDPINLDSLTGLAIAYYQTQAYAQAEKTYEQMIAIEDRAEFHNNLANVYRDWQKIDEAIAHYEEAIELDPTSALSYGNLAMMYWMDGGTEKAREIALTGIENTTGAGRDQLEVLLARLK